MLGQNPIRHRESNPDGALQIRGLPWLTIQGEGPYVGWPAVFIRLTGCNWKCFFCDTEWDDVTDRYMSVRTIADLALSILPRYPLVVITGGEPVRQDLDELVEFLVQDRADLIVQLETAGTLWQDILAHPQVRIICSPKTPRVHSKIYQHAAAFKYVVQARALGEDGLPVLSTQVEGQSATLQRPRPGAPVYLSPCDVGDEEANRANTQEVVRAALMHGYIAGIQLHKILNVP